MLRFPKIRGYSFAYLTVCLIFAENLLSPASAAPAGVRGTVADPAGHPVSGARVSLGDASTATDARGRFSIAGIAPGTYVERVSAARYEPYRATVVVPGDPQAIVLVPSAASLRVIGSVVAHPRSTFNATPVAVKVFPREAYRDQGQPYLDGVLAQTPGATPRFSDRTNLAARGVPLFGSLRGSLPFETAVSFDGVPLTLPSSGAFDLAAIPSFVLGDVELDRGPGDVAGVGPNAIAGTMNLRSAEPTATRRALAEFSVDSRGGSFDDIAYTGTMPGGKLAIAAMFATDGASGPAPNAAYPVALDRGATAVGGHPLGQNADPLHATGLYGCCVSAPADDLRRAQLLKLRYAPDDAFTLTATYLGSQTTRALAGAEGFALPLAFGAGTLDAFASYAAAIGEREDARLGLYDVDARIDRGRDGFDARLYAYERNADDAYGPTGARTLALTGTAYYLDGTPAQSFAGTPAQVDFGTSSAPAYAQRDLVRGGRISWQHETGSGLAIVSAERRDGASDGAVVGRSGDILLNAALQMHPDARSEVDIGGGFDRHDANGRSWDLLAFRAASSYRIRPQLAVRASLGTSFAPPPLDASGAGGAVPPAAVARIGLPDGVLFPLAGDLQPERACGYDLGAEWKLHGDTTTASLDYYDTRTRGAFARSLQTFGPVEIYGWFNARALHETGLEASLVQFKRQGLGFIVQGTLAGGDRDLGPNAFAVAPDGITPLATDAYLQGYSEISYHWPRGSRLSLGALFEGRNNPYGRPPFATFNSNLELSAGAKGKFQISIENLFDVDAGGLPLGPAGPDVLPPRTIRVMYRQSAGGGAVYER